MDNLYVINYLINRQIKKVKGKLAFSDLRGIRFDGQRDFYKSIKEEKSKRRFSGKVGEGVLYILTELGTLP